MKENAPKQYTIRNIPASLYNALRKKALHQKKSLNSLVLEALSRAADVGSEELIFDDLDDLIGSWVSDMATERALKNQRKVNPKDWTADK